MSDVNVGNLHATLTLDGSQYTSELKKTTKETQGLDTASANLATGLYNLQTMYGLATQAANYYKDAVIEQYSEIERFQTMTGASIEVSGKWQDMMEGLGMSLDEVTYAFRALSNNIQQAMGDSDSGANRAFVRLGVSLTDTNGKLRDSNAIMLDTISALQKMPAGADRNALAMDTLGRSYMSLGKLINSTTDATKLYTEAESNATATGMEKYRQFNLAMAKYNDTLEDLKATTGEKMLPFFTTLLGYATNVVEKMGTILESIEYMGYLAKEFSQGKFTEGSYFTREEYFTQKRLQEPGGIGGGAGAGAGAPGAGAGGTGTKGTSTNRVMAAAQEQIMINAKEIEALTQSIQTKKLLLEAAGADRIKLEEEIAEHQKKIDADVAENNILLQHSMNNTMKKLWNDVVQNMRENPAKASMFLDLFMRTFDEAGGTVPSPGVGYASDVDTPPAGGWSAASAYRTYMAAAHAAGYEYQEALEGWARGDWLPNMRGITSSNPAANTALYSQAIYMATGGPVLAGNPYIVGERGPELFLPSQSGTVIPNNGINIFVELDGDTIAKAVAAPLVGEIRVRTGVKF